MAAASMEIIGDSLYWQGPSGTVVGNRPPETPTQPSPTLRPGQDARHDLGNHRGHVGSHTLGPGWYIACRLCVVGIESCKIVEVQIIKFRCKVR